MVVFEGLIRSDVKTEIEMRGFSGARARQIYADVIHEMEPEALRHLNKHG